MQNIPTSKCRLLILLMFAAQIKGHQIERQHRTLKHVLLAVAQSQRVSDALSYMSHVMGRMMSHVLSHVMSSQTHQKLFL